MIASILHVITRLESGGTLPVLQALLRHCASRFDTTLVVGPSPSLERTQSPWLNDLGITWVVCPHLVRSPHVWHDLMARRWFAARMRVHQYDVIHTHTSKAGFHGRWAAHQAGYGSRVIHSTHGHVFSGYFSSVVSHAYAGLERLAAPWAARIVVLSESEREYHLNRGIGQKAQFAVIHHGIDLGPFAPSSQSLAGVRQRWGVPPEAKVICCVARLEPVKGHAALFEAFRLLRNMGHEDVWLVLAGDGTTRGALERQARRLQIDGRVRFLGTCDEIPALLHGSDVCVLPSLNEGFGLALVEAQAAGKPVVATAVGGIPEVVSPLDRPGLVPPDNPMALAVALKNILSDLSRSSPSSSAKRMAWAGRFTVQSMLEGYQALYDEVLHQR